MELTLRKMTMGDAVALSEKLRERNDALLPKRLAALHSASGIEPDQLPMVVAELTREPTMGETVRWCYTPAGSRAAIILLSGLTDAKVGAMENVLDVAGMLNEAIYARPSPQEGGARTIPPLPDSGAAVVT